MTGNLLVTPEQLRSASGEFSSTNGQVRTITGEMISLVNSLNSVWSGEAADAFKTKFNQLNDDIERIYRMIDEHVKDLQEMAAQYEKAEVESTENANALRGDVIN